MRFGGRMIWVTPDSMLKLWRRNLESVDPGLFSWVDRYVEPGMTVWDIGANVGLFTFAAAGKAGPHGRVLAVEADHALVALLRRSAAGYPAVVDILPAAVAGDNGIAELAIAARGRASNQVIGAVEGPGAGGIRETWLVPQVTLDFLSDHFPRPDLIKIDIEGMETEALRGGTQLLRQARPTIICEVWKQNAAEVASLVEQWGYSFLDLESGQPVARPAYQTLMISQ